MMKINFRKKQRGAALLLMFMGLFVLGTTVFLSATNNQSIALKQQAEVRYQLEAAKSALLAYAFNYESFNKNGDQGGGGNDFNNVRHNRLESR